MNRWLPVDSVSCKLYIQLEQKNRIGVDEENMIWYDSGVVRRFFIGNELAMSNYIDERRSLLA